MREVIMGYQGEMSLKGLNRNPTRVRGESYRSTG